MKAVLLAGLLLGTSCFSPGYSRYERRPDRYGYDRRSDRNSYDRRNDRNRSGRRSDNRPDSRRGNMYQQLPPGAHLERRGGETYARVRGGWLMWDAYRGAWVRVR